MTTQTNTIEVNNEVYTVTSCRIQRASGYGQYTVVVVFKDNNDEEFSLSYHSTDSQLFDNAHGEDNHDEIVFESVKYKIERSIENFEHLVD